MTVQVSTFEQFVKFGTDAYGLERLLRLIQALTQLLLSLPALRLLLLHPLLSAPSYSAVAPVVLQALRKRIASIRQAFRIFRFLDSFSSAWSVWSLPPHPDAAGSGFVAARVERWMDFGAKSFTGMYLLLESLTVAESLAVPGLSLWGEQRAAELAMDGQRFWFVGLVCGLLAGVLRLTAKEYVTGGTVADKRSQREVEKGKGRKRRVFRRVVADALDLAVPGQRSNLPEQRRLIFTENEVLHEYDAGVLWRETVFTEHPALPSMQFRVPSCESSTILQLSSLVKHSILSAERNPGRDPSDVEVTDARGKATSPGLSFKSGLNDWSQPNTVVYRWDPPIGQTENTTGLYPLIALEDKGIGIERRYLHIDAIDKVDGWARELDNMLVLSAETMHVTISAEGEPLRWDTDTRRYTIGSFDGGNGHHDRYITPLGSVRHSKRILGSRGHSCADRLFVLTV
ncbi:uncharacterized protein B0T15DRAFT_504591 [Chaetomium strumarium]|uniref:Uncharacterized protein n=1 Tax=Chaetomium strumarium TaxID=1170767 RepID=A0AAJ0GP84_9PEZI|nr:hypothetical protein B0T15DRAFT_504591 [Chaetomium strumarium]